ncbi:MAG: ABC transporter permease [Phycisphaerales bacterium]
MRPRDVLARLGRWQRSKPFKIIASIVVLALAIAAIGVVMVQAQQTPDFDIAEPDPTSTPLTPEERAEFDAVRDIAKQIANASNDPISVSLGIGIIAVVAIVTVWLGLGLTYLALGIVAFGIAWPMSLLGWTALSRLVIGVLILAAAFGTLMEALKALLSGAGPVLAIARNMLAEAIRMKVALVFIVVLILGLAYLPESLSLESPLRYRVQSFLQYGTGGSFWLIALLTLFLTIASVAFEQRDKQIWQTATKPVSAWQYILGKWVGMVGLNAVLLLVCCAGVFLFTEYLRRQPAQGEVSRMMTGAGELAISEDRRLLETQVLTARVTVEPAPPFLKTDPAFQEGVKAYIENARKSEPTFAVDPGMREVVESDLYKSAVGAARVVEVGQRAAFQFYGLEHAKRHSRMLTLRYKIDAGSNEPQTTFRVTFIFGGTRLPTQVVGLGTMQTLTIPTPQVIDEQGHVELAVFNGELVDLADPPGAIAIRPNESTMAFSKDGLEISYSRGSFAGNFARVVGVLWLKLAFLSMLGIACATFLSFPVACLVAFAIFFAAEGGSFLTMSLEYYDAAPQGKEVEPHRVVIRAIGLVVAWALRPYAELQPTARLVDGKLLDWLKIGYATGMVAAWTAVLYLAGVLIFRRRELATYSGH